MPAPGTTLGQLFLISFIFLCSAGMFNALSGKLSLEMLKLSLGMGGAGKASNKIVENASATIAATFTFSSFVAPAVICRIGVVKLAIPSVLAYALYVASYLFDSDILTITAAALLGVGAGLLWTIQTSLLLSYPAKGEKGRYFSIFWIIFNSGAALGAIIPLISEWNSGIAPSISTLTYILFIGIILMGAILSFFLKDPNQVIRSDGSFVSSFSMANSATFMEELSKVVKLILDWRMVLLIPLFAGSNWFYTYQFNIFNNGGLFTLRARSLNNVLYWVCQMFGAGLFGIFLDSKRIPKISKAVISNLFVLFFMTFVWIRAITIQQTFTRESGMENKAGRGVMIDINDPSYIWLLVEYACFGIGDAIFQTYIYWILGTMTCDPHEASRFGGFFKTFQNIGNIISNQLDSNMGLSFMTQLLITFAINVIGLLAAIPVSLYVASKTSQLQKV